MRRRERIFFNNFFYLSFFFKIQKKYQKIYCNVYLSSKEDCTATKNVFRRQINKKKKNKKKTDAFLQNTKININKNLMKYLGISAFTL